MEYALTSDVAVAGLSLIGVEVPGLDFSRKVSSGPAKWGIYLAVSWKAQHCLENLWSWSLVYWLKPGSSGFESSLESLRFRVLNLEFTRGSWDEPSIPTGY